MGDFKLSTYEVNIVEILVDDAELYYNKSSSVRYSYIFTKMKVVEV